MTASVPPEPAPLPYHRLDGPADGRPMILGPSLGTSLAVWEPQLPALIRTHRVLRWDLPGHGASPAEPMAGSSSELIPCDGTATVAHLAELVLRAADAQGWDEFAYAGVSLGGAVGLHLAVHHPERLTALSLVCSSARFGEPAAWRERAAAVRAHGTESMIASRPGVWFAPDFEGTPHGTALIEDLRCTAAAGYAACCDALAAFDLRGQLAEVTVPTLAVAGRLDPATPPAHAREIADGIPGAALVEVAGAAHLANAECPDAVTSALLVHHDGLPGPGERW
ncbi:3-oxoadipate enol-lactone hydrolase [Streptomyces abyssalis]|uniref:3-oxoadipate enol-lactone hydrolase n=1 Tax=Streptomyces abyssalis TaxID=933944 RepID=A0A1E7JK87_9ACTN|nr:alpha/beta fold hydrolase [Streptomyces abyssalis]OEU88032.1 3-oxoadipate enol-lactone hydrolase [Streptomyces abyssalis]OEU90897.1 3-oxoadipate enol-lactone hydrolase [Streptomyces abyssalis]OEU90899.1 3-oxoadipate enol-lactone hydrolase [Streptomyces abyssalis]